MAGQTTQHGVPGGKRIDVVPLSALKELPGPASPDSMHLKAQGAVAVY